MQSEWLAEEGAGKLSRRGAHSASGREKGQIAWEACLGTLTEVLGACFKVKLPREGENRKMKELLWLPGTYE